MCPVLHIRTLCQGQKPQRGHSSLPSPVPVTASPQTRPQWLALSLHLPSLFRHWQSEADRQPSSVVSQDSCCERVGKGYRVCFATKKASLEIKKKKKSALICAKVTFLCVKSACGRAAQREESVLRGAGASRSSPASPGCASARSPGTPGSGRPRCSPRTLGRQKRG